MSGVLQIVVSVLADNGTAEQRTREVAYAGQIDIDGVVAAIDMTLGIGTRTDLQTLNRLLNTEDILNTRG
jgi:hypothetical protein